MSIPSVRVTQHVRSRSLNYLNMITGVNAAATNVQWFDVKDFARILVSCAMAKPYNGSAGVTLFSIVATDNLAPLAASATFATYNIDTTRVITIGAVSVSSVDAGGTLAAALATLAVALNASTDPKFDQFTWTSNATQIIGTLTNPVPQPGGLTPPQFVPPTFYGSVSAGTGTCSVPYAVTSNVQTLSDGNNAIIVKMHPLASKPKVAGDQVFLEIDAQELKQVGVEAGQALTPANPLLYKLRYISVQVQSTAATDLLAIEHHLCMPRFPQDLLTNDFVGGVNVASGL